MYVLSHFDGAGGMCLFLVLFWCLPSWDDAEVTIPGSASFIPDWAEPNSRLALLREFARKALICLTIFSTNGGCVRKIDKVPVVPGKTGNFARSSETGSWRSFLTTAQT